MQTGQMQSAPAGYSVRPATVEDAETIFAIQSAHETPLIGSPNATLEDVVDELVEPGFDIETDGWLVLTDTGEPVGWAWACRKGISDNVDISAYVRPGHDEAAGWLWAASQQRSAEIGRELGHSKITLDVGIFPEDALNRRLAERNGFAAAATFIRMRIDHPQHVAYPPLPPGVELRNARDDVEVRQAAINVRNEAFADHFGFVPKTFEEWVKEREASSAHDWSLIDVVYVEGEPAATTVRTNNFVPDENCGYVLTLGTAPKYQGRGLGSYLLRNAFASDAEQGRIGTILHVDTNPTRPAVGLYLKNGMRQVLTIDVWRRSLMV